MYDRATNHTKQLQEAILKTKLMMQKIRIGEEKQPRGSSEPVSKNHDDSDRPNLINKGHRVFNKNRKNSDDKQKSSVKRAQSDKFQDDLSRESRRIAEMSEEDLQTEWARHEGEVHEYLEEREKINDQASVLVSADANSSRMSFEQFWRQSCKVWGDIAILFFYAGTANLLLAIMIYMWAEFFLQYHNLIGAIISVCVVGISIVVGIALYMFLRQGYNSRHQKAKALLMKSEKIIDTDDSSEDNPIDLDDRRTDDFARRSIRSDASKSK